MKTPRKTLCTLGVLAILAVLAIVLLSQPWCRPVLVAIGIAPSPRQEAEAFIKRVAESDTNEDFPELFSNQTAAWVAYPFVKMAPRVRLFRSGAKREALGRIIENYPIGESLEEFLDKFGGSGRQILWELHEIENPSKSASETERDPNRPDYFESNRTSTPEPKPLERVDFSGFKLIEIDERTMKVIHPSIQEGVEIHVIFEDDAWRIHLPHPEAIGDIGPKPQEETSLPDPLLPPDRSSSSGAIEQPIQ